MKIYDLRGQRFGRLTVIELTRVRGLRGWKCLCDCGQYTSVATTQLTRSASTRSCGCLIADAPTIHGQARKNRITLSFRRWANMINRCSNPHTRDYPLYGGRGISVCERWLSFQNFHDDMGDAPAGCSLDRIDNDGDYSKNNCRWATQSTQTGNTRRAHMLTINGETHCMSEWAHKVGMPYSRLRARIAHGWNPERAIALGKVK